MARLPDSCFFAFHPFTLGSPTHAHTRVWRVPETCFESFCFTVFCVSPQKCLDANLFVLFYFFKTSPCSALTGDPRSWATTWCTRRIPMRVEFVGAVPSRRSNMLHATCFPGTFQQTSTNHQLYPCFKLFLFQHACRPKSA